ncbi:putative mitochondrial protein [Vitis vinifera]|uniref:Putative mitochondrial protein n=1 Tax=Vitis vinifera TaxID=29760 RepID=A0A438DEX1_VITVI|nr:putative mitochondrial protein [Vitis vinifera]
MSELVTKVSSSSAPPVIPSTMTVQHDNVHVQMTSNKLDGMNYSGWSQFVKLNTLDPGALKCILLGYSTSTKGYMLPPTFRKDDTLYNPKWKDAMVEEMKALQKNDTWELVELPKGKKTIGCKWLFTMKHKVDGSVERFKARLVAKGQSDYTLFLNHAFEGNIIALIMHVDDIVVRDIEVARSKLGIFDSIFDLLDETGMLACKPVDTPIELNHKLGESL